MSELFYTQTDARVLWENLLKDFEQALSTKLESTDERRLFLQQQLQVIVAFYNSLNFAARMSLLRYAYGVYLDAIGEDRGVMRKSETAAETTLVFSLQAARQTNVLIPAGTRGATEDGSVKFRTVTAAVISAGEMQVGVDAECTVTGESGNGYYEGVINVLVDPIAYVYSVANTTVTAGGADVEEDEPYRQRIRLSYAQTSTAGAEDSYKYWAATASPAIADVSVSSPGPAQVLVVPLLEGGEIPTSEVIDAVKKALNQKTVRPITDQVLVEPPTASEYTIDFDYYAPLAQGGEVIEKVEGEGGAIDKYVAWQKAAISRNRNPDYLRKLLFDAGVTKMTIRSPSHEEGGNQTVFIEDRTHRTANFMPEVDNGS